MDAAVKSFHLSLSPTSSSSLTRFRPHEIQCQSRSFQILLYIVHPPLLWASKGRFPVIFQSWTMDGHLSLFILAIWQYHVIFLFRTVFSAISCPDLTRTSTLLTLSIYLIRSIRRNHRFSHAFWLISMAVVKFRVLLPYSNVCITAAFYLSIYVYRTTSIAP